MNENMENLYQKALEFATKAHGDQKRKYTGEPYITHPIAVAKIIKDAVDRKKEIEEAKKEEKKTGKTMFGVELKPRFGRKE